LEEYSEEWGEEGDKANPGGGGTVYDSLRFPSASYFLGLPLFFFPNNSPLPVVVFVAIFIVVVVVVVVVTPRLVSTAMFTTIWGGATWLKGAGGESVSEFPVDPENVLSFSSIKLCLNRRSGGCFLLFCFCFLEEEVKERRREVWTKWVFCKWRHKWVHGRACCSFF
jgi:hypothetical protein